MEAPKEHDSLELQAGEHIQVQGERCVWRGHESPTPISHTWPDASLPLDCCLMISFIINEE